MSTLPYGFVTLTDSKIFQKETKKVPKRPVLFCLVY